MNGNNLAIQIGIYLFHLSAEPVYVKYTTDASAPHKKQRIAVTILTPLKNKK